MEERIRIFALFRVTRRIEIFLSIIEFSKVVKINTVFDTARMKLTNNRHNRIISEIR